MGKQAKKQGAGRTEVGGMGGFLGGLGTLLEKLSELSDKGEEFNKSGEFKGADGKVRGVYGFNIKVGLGDEGVKVEPFGNLGKDEKTGRPVVQEIREPLVDIFEEETCVLVVAEMPGVSEGDVQVDVHDDILTISAAKGEKKYRKEVLLPASFTPPKMAHTCRNGVLEVRLAR